MFVIALYFSLIYPLVWPTRLIYLAMGEVHCDGFNLAVLYPSDKVGNNTRICIVNIKYIVEITLSTSCHLA